MASMREIRRRRDSIQSTEQITKAMKLSATVKLTKTKARAEKTRPYAAMMRETLQSLLSRAGGESHTYSTANSDGKRAVIAITSNRGLAGGYNQNIIRMIASDHRFSPKDTWIYAIGRKGKDGLSRKGFSIREDYSDVINEPVYSDAADLALELLDGYKRGEIGEIYLAFTAFVNTVTHRPTLLRLLPMEPVTEASVTDAPNSAGLVEFEPDKETVLAGLLPVYLGSLIYSGLLEAAASEQGARMTAMDLATNNAEDMLAALELKYNRARQGSITQELTEIIAGANAIS